MCESYGHKYAISCNKDTGPSFGEGELVALYEKFDESKQRKGYTSGKLTSYGISLKSYDGSRRCGLTHLHCDLLNSSSKKYKYYSCDFTIKELEVWEVILEE